MVVAQEVLKTCRLCKRSLPRDAFHTASPGKATSRCKRCHGVAVRRCRVCRRLFVGKAGRKACSPLCHDLMRAPTYLVCRQCNRVFGPADHLKRKYCSTACQHAAAATGRVTVRKTLGRARNAQSLLAYHVRAGHVVRPDRCEACGATGRPIDGAHYNYDEPLRVRWLCRSCHVKWDKREPKNATVIVAGPGRRRRATDETTPAVQAGVGEGVAG